MARTRLFGQLRRIAARVLVERRPEPHDLDAGLRHLTRRQLTFAVVAPARAQARRSRNQELARAPATPAQSGALT
jgi:hypothetical protein